MTTHKPRVSVGLPVYNGEKYVAEAIESILAQTYTDWELIITDNCSEDATEEICRPYVERDERIRYYRYARNLGAGPNQNQLLNWVRGVYFIWIMHDDVYGPRTLELCVEALDRNPDAVLSYPRMIDVDAEGRVIAPHDENCHLVDEQPHRRVGKCVVRAIICNAALGLIRVESLWKTRLIGDYRGSDHTMLAELSMIGKFYEVPERLYYRRVHCESSLGANKDPLSIAHWFNPNIKKVGRHFKLRMFWEYVVSVVLAELPLWEKFLCFLAIWRWPWLQFRNWIGFHKRRLLGRLQPETQ